VRSEINLSDKEEFVGDLYDLTAVASEGTTLSWDESHNHCHVEVTQLLHVTLNTSQKKSYKPIS